MEALDALRRDMDLAADPCQDFYRYACGGWLERTEIPGDEARWTRGFGEIAERRRGVLKQVLEDAVARAGDDPERARLGAFYAACMNEDAIERVGIAPLSNLLRRIEGIHEPWTLMKVAGQLHSIGIQVFFASGIEAAREDSQRAIVLLRPGGLGLPDRALYLDADEGRRALLQDYERHVARMLALSGENASLGAENARIVVAFETALAGLPLPPAGAGDPYLGIDRAGLKQRIPKIAWDAFLEGAETADANELGVTSFEYFQELSSLLAATRVRDLKAYLRWQLIHGLADALPAAFAEEHFGFYSARLAGQKRIAPRWKRCVDAADRALGPVLEQAYVARAPSAESRAAATRIGRGIISAFEGTLADLAWMDATTRNRAGERLRALTIQVASPDPPRELAEIELEPDTHLLNVIVARRLQARLGPGHSARAALEASYEPTQDTLVLPAALLQPPLLDASFPPVLNYAGIGSILGRELVSGFDGRGDWWEPETASRFEERAGCVAQGENVADLGGIRQAHRAWRAQAGDPGSPDTQLFFVAYAQTWCVKTSPELTRVLASVDPHADPRSRVIGPLANFPEFARAFHCPEGAPMRPARACAVW